jgi:hypothetical protein
MTVSRTIRHRLEVQGFCNLDDAAMNELAPWLRWSPALCTTVIGIGVVLRAPLVLWGLAAIALFGAALPFHPFDVVYNHLVRHFTRTASLPHHGAQRRFACALATVWLVATGWAFYVGNGARANPRCGASGGRPARERDAHLHSVDDL